MVYKAIGVASNGSVEELQLVYCHLQEKGGLWSFDILHAGAPAYPDEWIEKLKLAPNVPARDYLLLHSAFGQFIGQQVNRFIEAFSLHHRVDLVASHGHTAFHMPGKHMTAQLGDGAAIAAVTALPVVTDLRALDIALKGQGGPIESIGDKLLFSEYDLVLSLGEVAQLSARTNEGYVSCEVCAAGSLATEDAWKTCVMRIAQQVESAVSALPGMMEKRSTGGVFRLLVTGTFAKNVVLVTRISAALQPLNVDVVLPEGLLVDYKEALVIALLGVLRWREEYTVVSSVTGATRSSIGGALWLGGEA